MMFSGIMLKRRSSVRNIAVAGIVLLLLVNILEMCGTVFFKFDTKGMIAFDRFALLFNTIAFISTLLYLLLSARDMEKVGINYGEYLALINSFGVLEVARAEKSAAEGLGLDRGAPVTVCPRGAP